MKLYQIVLILICVMGFVKSIIHEECKHKTKSKMELRCVFFFFCSLRVYVFFYVDGQLELDIFNGEAYLLYDGIRCDDNGYDNICDAFIKIYQNGKLDYMSNWIWDAHAPKFNLKYASPVIRNTTKMTIEMWDKNRNTDVIGLMDRWVFNPITRIAGVKRLQGHRWSKNEGETNKLFIDASWTWMPNYEPSR